MTNGQSDDKGRSILFVLMSVSIPVLVLFAAVFGLLTNWIDFDRFLVVFSAVTAAIALVFWIGRHLGLTYPPLGIEADRFQTTLNTLFVTTLLGAIVTTATKQITATQGLTDAEKVRRFYNPSDVFFGPQDFSAARRQSFLLRRADLTSRNLKNHRIIYIRYITASKQVQLENYVDITPVNSAESGELRLAFQDAEGSTPANINYFKYSDSNVSDLYVRQKTPQNTFPVDISDKTSVVAVKYYNDFESQGDFFLTPLFQIQGSPRTNVEEYVILSQADAKVWNPNKYLFDLTAAPEPPLIQVSYSSQIYSNVDEQSPSTKEISTSIQNAINATARCGKDFDCSRAKGANELLSQIFDTSKSQLKSGILIFKSSSLPADMERAMWFRLCLGGNQC